MKISNLKSQISNCVALLLLATLPACTTTPTGQKVPDVAMMSNVAETAVFAGTTIWLQGAGTSIPAHPDDKAKFQAARNGVAALIAAGTFSAGDLTAALQALPIKELKGPTGAVAVEGALVLWDAYGRQLTTLDKSQVFTVYVLPIAQAILKGLDHALAN